MQIQNNKQIASSLKAKNLVNATAVQNPGIIAANRVSARWSTDEYQLAIRGMRKHGKNFQSIAEIIGTKNESQVNQFYTNYRKKFNLEDIIKEYEANELQEQQQKQKLTEAQQNAPSNSNPTNIAIKSDVKPDLKKPLSDYDVMEVSS